MAGGGSSTHGGRSLSHEPMSPVPARRGGRSLDPPLCDELVQPPTDLADGHAGPLGELAHRHLARLAENRHDECLARTSAPMSGTPAPPVRLGAPEDDTEVVHRRAELRRLEPAVCHLPHHERDPRAVPLGRGAAFGQRRERHEPHDGGVSTAGAAVREILPRLPPEAARVRDLNAVVKDVDGDRLPVRLSLTVLVMNVSDGTSL